MMSKNGKFGKFLVGFFQVIIVLGMLWGEFGGIYHSFKHYGVGDGLIAVFVPPYSWYRSIEFFFWMKRGGLTKAERNEIGHFGKSIRTMNNAMNVLQESTLGIVGTIEQEKLNESLNLMRESLREAQNVRDEVLSKLHPDLPSHYREEFCEGIRLTIQGFERANPQISLKGQLLQDKWGDWYEAHIHELRGKLLGRDIKPSKSKSKPDTLREVTQKWPELTAEELSEISAVIGKALQEPLKDKDLERIKRVNKSYMKRVGRSMTRQESELFTQLIEITYQYNYELGRCLLHSIDSKQPFISDDLERLRAIMESLGFARKSKLDADFRKITSAAKGDVWTDEFGQQYHPLTREDALARLEEMQVMKDNFEKLSEVFKELVAEQVE
jgi:hypothetical protein